MRLVDVHTQRSIELMKYLDFFNVNHITWSDDGRHVAVADSGGEIFIKRLLLPTPGVPKADIEVQALASPIFKLEGQAIHYIMFNHDSSLLLVACQELGQIWSVDEATEATMVVSGVLEGNGARRWLRHPFRKDLFAGFGVSDVVVLSWDGLEEESRHRYEEDRRGLDTTINFNSNDDDKQFDTGRLSLSFDADPLYGSTVNKALITYDCKHILVQIRDTSVQRKIVKRCLLFDTSTFETDCNGSLIYAFIPPQIAAIIDIPLTILPGSRFSFLDRDLWVCTLKLGTKQAESLRRHYFIPRDWTSTNSLQQSCMMKDGTLLFPKDDAVAVVRSALDVGGFWDFRSNQIHNMHLGN